MPDKKIQVGFADIANSHWTAGLNYYSNLFRALRSLPLEEQPVLALLRESNPAKTGYEQYQELVDAELLVPSAPPIPPPNFWNRQTQRARRALRLPEIQQPCENPFSSFLRAQQVEVIFASFREFGPDLCVPLLSWIHDFQDLHYPELFRPEDLAARERAMRRMTRYATRIVLSSEDAHKDLARFAPDAIQKARVMHFVAHIPHQIFEQDPAWICEEYRLPQKFIFLPNQFWRHKNHGLVLDALALLRHTRPEICIVCSGNPNDFRASLYFGELLAKISRLGLREQFVILGWVPHLHMFHLMRQALAVLQPSLFEGWSTTVEETKSLGKTLVLSEIPVHREQNPRNAYWFDPRDPRALADCLIRAYDEKSAGPDRTLEEIARAEFSTRVQAFGRTFMQIVKEALEDVCPNLLQDLAPRRSRFLR